VNDTVAKNIIASLQEVERNPHKHHPDRVIVR